MKADIQENPKNKFFDRTVKVQKSTTNTDYAANCVCLNKASGGIES